jgi:hypothetical protein
MRIFITIVLLIFLWHLIYLFIFFLPAVVSLMREQRAIIKLFYLLPKESIGKAYNTAADKCKYKQRKLRTYRVISPIKKLVVCFLIVFVIDAVYVALCLYDAVETVFGHSSAPYIISNNGNLGATSNRIVINVAEVVFYDRNLDFNTSISAFLSDQEEKLRTTWVQIRYGYGSIGGLVGATSQIDNIVFNDVCFSSVSSEVYGDPFGYYCESLNDLVDMFLINNKNLYLSYNSMTIEEQVLSYRKLISTTEAITSKSQYVISLYATYVKDTQGLGKRLVYIFIGIIIALTFMLVPLWTSLEHKLLLCHETRRMFNFISCDVIESIPEVNSFVQNHVINLRKASGTESEKTKAVLEGSHDGIVICSIKGTVIEVNGSAKKIFHITESDVIGRSVRSLFEEDVSLSIKETLKNSH